MNAIRSVFAAFTNLAASVNALAGVIDAATGRLRQQLALDEAPPALTHGGQVLDAAPIPAEDASTPTAKGRNGRVKTTA